MKSTMLRSDTTGPPAGVQSHPQETCQKEKQNPKKHNTFYKCKVRKIWNSYFPQS